MKNYFTIISEKKVQKLQEGDALQRIKNGLTGTIYSNNELVPIEAVEEEEDTSDEYLDALKKARQDEDKKAFNVMTKKVRTSNTRTRKDLQATEDLISGSKLEGEDLDDVNQNLGQARRLVFENNMLGPIGGNRLGISGNTLADIGVKAINAVDNLAMGDKNFGAQSAAIDSAVHGVSSALMKSGNPYMITAGAALEGANFLTKAGGQTVQGFDVDINNSGFGTTGHRDSSSSRDFGAMIGLGGINPAKMSRQLANRNTDALRALKAAGISDAQAFEIEARSLSTDDVIRKNQIALNGGIDTSLLAAKNGAKITKKSHVVKLKDEHDNLVLVDLNKLSSAQKNGEQSFAFKNKNYYLAEDGKTCVSESTVKDRLIQKAQNGAKLEQIEVSEEVNVLPTGALHKNKHENFDLDVTKKGIPVITVEDDTAETLEEIQEQKDTIMLHAEVEAAEVIFNKEVTDYIEDARKKWHESGEKDNSLCLEVGKRICKELLFNTMDNGGIIEKIGGTE